MERNKSQLSRLLELDGRIRRNEYPNCGDFARDWEVSRKTIQRDIDYMRDCLGAPIEFDPARNGYRYTDKNWFLPAIQMTEGELLGIVIGVKAMQQYKGTPIASQIGRVFAKLTGGLKDKVTVNPETLFSQFTFTSPPAREIQPMIWISVVRALQVQRQLKILYQANTADAPSWRVVEPYHLVNLQGEWYLLAHCLERNEVRQFAVARITACQMLDESFEIAPDFNVEFYLAATFSRFLSVKKSWHVHLVFDDEVRKWIEDREWCHGQKMRIRRNGSLELSFRASSLIEVFRWVLGWGRHVKVLAPKELRNMVRDEVKAMGE